MSNYGMEDSNDYNGYRIKSVQATKVHKILFAIIGIAIAALIVCAFIFGT